MAYFPHPDDGFTGYAPKPDPNSVPPFGEGPVTIVNATGNINIDSLLAQPKWGGAAGTGATIEYSFPGFGATWRTGYGSGEPFNGFAPLNAAQQNAARAALDYWAEVANINFVEVADTASNVGSLRFGVSSVPGTAHAYYPSTSPEGGDSWYGTFYHGGRTSYPQGTYYFHTFLHEIGHALGLKHPHDTGGTGRVQNAADDWLGTSVMSYRSSPGASTSGGYNNDFYPSKPMLNDIMAIQHLYGANTSTRAGNTTYSWSTGERLFETIWDGGGTDTISWANQSTTAIIRLGAGQWSELGPAYTWSGGSTPRTLVIARNVTIENAAGGSGSDQIYGNAAANVLSGNGGSDLLVGGGGADQLRGDAGTDRFKGTVTDLNGDRIADFTNTDVIEVEARQFGTAAVRYQNGQLQADTDGNGSYDLGIFVGGVTNPAFQARAFGTSTEIRIQGGPIGGDDYPGNTSTTATLAVGQTRTGNIETFGDADWFRVQLTAGVTYTIDLQGTASGAGTLSDPHVYLHNSAGTLIADHDDTSTSLDSKLIYRPTSSGTYYLSAREHGDDAIGTYRIGLSGPGGPTDGDDVITGTSGPDTIDARAGNDTVRGGGGNDTIGGGEGNDYIHGEAGNDNVNGAPGNDTVLGGEGADNVRGGPGTDLLWGIGGNDRFDFDGIIDSVVGSARDRIADFVKGQDKIDLTDMDANAGASGNQAFAFKGTGALTGAAQVRAFISGSDTVIQGSTDGDSAAEFEIVLTGKFTLAASDFVL